MGKGRLLLSKQDCEYILQKAVDAYSRGDWGETEKLLQGYIGIEPDDVRPWQLLGSTLLAQGQRRFAEKAYEKAYAIDPQDPYTLVALGEIALDALRIEDAKPYFEQLFALDKEGRHPAANRGRVILKQALERLG